MKRAVLAAVLALAPGAAAAHAAFGQLGPFYASLLHPLADPGQGVLIAAIAILLARQPLAAVRPGHVALALCGILTLAANRWLDLPPPGLRATAGLAAALGVAALLRLPLPPAPAAVVAGATAAIAALGIDIPPGLRPAALSILGGGAGIALGALVVWGLVDLAQGRFGPVAGAVAGSWIAAVWIMAAALPS